MAAIPKRVRYEVLRRDGYRCRYCGATAQDTKLQVDAVVPESLGGSHQDPTNLVAACQPCNSGKTSSSPDAPLVADVADDALRWSQAMTAAAGRMLAEMDAREEDRNRFCRRWDAWGTGEGKVRRYVPMDPNWRQTVDLLISAGLPIAVLEDCVDVAMTTRKVKAASKFRYMCGIAWKRVSEIQGVAREIVSAAVLPGDDGNERLTATQIALIEAGRSQMAADFLKEMPEVERNNELTEARRRCEEEAHAVRVAAYACLYGLLLDRQDLARSARWLLERHDGGPAEIERATSHLEALGYCTDAEVSRVAALRVTGMAAAEVGARQ